VKIRKEFLIPAGGNARAGSMPVLETVLAPSLSDYGYRKELREEEGAGAVLRSEVTAGAKLRLGDRSDPPAADSLCATFHDFRGTPESRDWSGLWLGFVAVGAAVQRTPREPAMPASSPAWIRPRWALSISPAVEGRHGGSATGHACACEYFLAVPIHEGHAHRPWLHTSFNS